jgi:predicted nucleic acid-binding protein
MAIVADSGGIYALYDTKDAHHKAVRGCFAKSPQQIHLPASLLGELGYMLGEWLGTKALLQFLADITEGAYRVEPFLDEDLHRCETLVNKYSDLRLGLCDAAVVALAERLGIGTILTVGRDERHLRVIRTVEGRAFRLLPEDRKKR